MAAAESERDSPSALCSEFLSFSAKDTASVSVSPKCQHSSPFPVRLHSRSEICHLRKPVFGGRTCLCSVCFSAKAKANAKTRSLSGRLNVSETSDLSLSDFDLSSDTNSDLFLLSVFNTVA